MRFRGLFLGLLTGWGLLVWSGADEGSDAEAEAVSFRESFYASEVDRDRGIPLAVRVGGVVFVSGLTAPGETMEAQLRGVYLRLGALLGQYGLSLANVAQERIYTTDLASLEACLELRHGFFDAGMHPASTRVQVLRLSGEGHLLEIEVMAVVGPEE